MRAGNVGRRTPHLEALSKKGVVFKNAYTTITKTDPAVSAIMTGRYPVSLGLVNHGPSIFPFEERNLSSVPFLAEILKKAGFQTGAIDWLGRWHRRGFDYYSDRLSVNLNSADFIKDKLPWYFYLRTFDKFLIRLIKRDLFMRLYYGLFPSPLLFYDPASVVVDEALRFLEKQKDRKVFLFLHFWDTHAPYPRRGKLWPYLFDEIEENYQGMVQYLDSELGRFFAYLSKSGLEKETLVIFTADHGENFGKGRPLNHEGLEEEVVKVPLVLRFPGWGHLAVEELVQHVDLLPTLLSTLEIPIPKGVDGQNLSGLVSGRKQKVRGWAYFEDLASSKLPLFGKAVRRRGLRIGPHKYVQSLFGRKKDFQRLNLPKRSSLREELYNLEADPEGKNNLLIGRYDYQSKLEEIATTLIEKGRRERSKGKLVSKLKDSGGAKGLIMKRLKAMGYW